MRHIDSYSTHQAVILHGGLSGESMASLELETGEALGALNSCLDPSILSIFEDTPTEEDKTGLDEENEATLLTALTEILDNVDDENLSPFDTLPDSDLLSGQKGREQSPLRKLLCLSRTPPEKEMYCNTRHFSTGKSLPRAHVSIQRSDGEEEEDGEACSLSLSPNSHPSSLEQGLLGWGDLPVPLVLEQEMEAEVKNGASLSVSLGELVRHMHPYCMAVCLENGEEQLLPEEGIFLEVVDQGEHGETIFAITDMGLPLTVSQPNPPLPGMEVLSGMELMVPADVLQNTESANNNNDVVVDDDEPAEVADPAAIQRCEVIGRSLKQKMSERYPSRRKKNRKNKDKSSTVEVALVPAPAGGRVLRSSSNMRAPLEPLSQKPIKEKAKHEEKNVKEPFISAISTAEAPKPKPKVLRLAKTQQSQHRTEGSALTLPTHPGVKVILGSKPVFNVRPLGQLPMSVNTTPGKVFQPSADCPKPQGPPASASATTATQTIAVTMVTPTSSSSTAPQALKPSKAPMSLPSPMNAPPSIAPSASLQMNPQPVEAAAIEPKPRPLSLEQYRLLRQQKKPAPVGRKEDQSTKWPSLPEPPTELPPIPCLPTPSLRDPRRTQLVPGKNEAQEVKAPWQPLGPGAPPTPEALLVPPAYMKSSKCSSTKVAGATAALTVTPRQAFSTAAASQPQPTLSAVPASPSGEVVAPLSQTSSTQTLYPELSYVQSSPLLNNQHPTLKPVVLTKSQSSVGASLKTTTPVHRPTQIAAVLPPKSTPVAATVPERTLNPAVVAFSVQKRTLTALPKVGATLQKAVAAFPQPKMSLATAAPTLTQASNPLLRCTPTQKAPKAKSPTQELIEAFTSEIGIEAADLTSLLEQFEETQAKEEQCVLEVSCRAAAVGNSSVEQPCDRTAVERVKAHDLSNTAGLTPPATPPHQMWKPLAPMALLGKNRALEALKPSPSKAIQIDPRPLPSNKLRCKPPCHPVTIDPVAVSLAFLDHDYCLPQKEPVGVLGEPGKRWNVKQQAAITIKTIELLNGTRAPQMIPAPPPQPLTPALGEIPQQAPIGPQFLDVRTVSPSSMLETPEASPNRLEEQAGPVERFPKKERSYRGYNTDSSTRPIPGPSEGNRGRERKRFHHSSSPCSTGSETDSHSSSRSRSRSPPRKRYRPRRPESSSSASSCSSRCSSRSRSPPRSCSPTRRRRYSYSSSRSGSWSTSRSRSPLRRSWGRSSRRHSPSLRTCYRPVSKENTEEVKRLKEKAIEERRVVYVGRIRGTMTRKELKDRFSLYGEIEECTLHFRDHGDNYGFVTYYDTKDAFTAIENGGKLRKPDELPFDLCFGGRRQFCKTSYADLDSNRDYDPSPTKGKFDALDFDTLLKQAQKSLKR
ncbi:peroxisome proliferator-activated receptor gamma coactivator-related protein 1 isoform X2 [Esox lucius]|uniref:peroxisome proliferator-activated receptor gamma coactivator-related protein 1 isoform X2 n=1 Tax=Esox lucius TaxID=8010 RepID=UPI0005760E63|nr:peroxisome proliferator-activated receptor gamma coactivator-related protein 1 isoform X2 [Esox lucius]